MRKGCRNHAPGLVRHARRRKLAKRVIGRIEQNSREIDAGDELEQVDKHIDGNKHIRHNRPRCARNAKESARPTPRSSCSCAACALRAEHAHRGGVLALRADGGAAPLTGDERRCLWVPVARYRLWVGTAHVLGGGGNRNRLNNHVVERAIAAVSGSYADLVNNRA